MSRLFFSALLLTLSACSFSRAGRPMGKLAAEINATRIQGDMVLAPGDVLAVNFPLLDQWSQEDVVVQPDGHATFLSLGDLQVSGLTLALLDTKLTEEYATKVLAQPELTVSTTKTAPRNVFIIGEVKGPGSYPLESERLSLVEALGMSEGFIRDTAKLTHTMLVRWIPEENQIRAWKIDASLSEWGAPEPIWLQPHDVLFIPAKPVVHVNDWLDRYIRRMIPLPGFGYSTL